MNEQAPEGAAPFGADVPENADLPENAAVTGVARGSLGTGTALEETQEWVIPEEVRAAPAPRHEAMGQRAADDGQIVPAPVPAAVAALPEAAPRRRTSRPVGGFAATPRAAGIAAVALLALVGVAAVLTSQDQQTPGAVAAPTDLATSAPTAAPPADAGGGNGGNGDKGKNDKGGGNGKGNGGGNGND
jgi:hypothetical protein